MDYGNIVDLYGNNIIMDCCNIMDYGNILLEGFLTTLGTLHDFHTMNVSVTWSYKRKRNTTELWYLCSRVLVI